MYLFGSVHAANVKSYEFPEYFNKAFDSSDYVTCEYDSTIEQNGNEIIQALKMFYVDGSKLKDHVSSETYDKINKFLKENGIAKALESKGYKVEKIN